MLTFVAEQLALDPARFADYAERDQTRRAHLAEIQTAFGYLPFTRGRYRELAASLLPTALATEKAAALVAMALDALRTQRIMVPPCRPSNASVERSGPGRTASCGARSPPG